MTNKKTEEGLKRVVGVHWAASDTSQVVIRGILIFTPDHYGMDSVKFEQLVKENKIQLF